MSDLDVVMDAIGILNDFSLSQAGDGAAFERLTKREKLPEGIAAVIKAKQDALAKAKAEELAARQKQENDKTMPIQKRYGKPIRDEYATDEEFAKALEEYKAFIQELRGELEVPIGETIKKSLVPPKPENKPKDLADINKMFKDAGVARDLKTLMYQEGVE